ncbi:BRO family protein [Eubacterium sp. 1001713B170207_170306_E7]|uniref:BRO-N domain-containing protein n=1 Tax=Eubacterium sp. 1001713B170207_170306_E7 TaxID=2787097 RepID=UPI0018998F63|nr:BRO family protein [Eubacterium sp. 1001713B170207_170306_E7]
MNKHTILKMDRFESPLFGSIRTLVETVDVKAHNTALEQEIQRCKQLIMYEEDCEVTCGAMDRIIALKKQLLKPGDQRREWFVVQDVCRALGFKNHIVALHTHVCPGDRAKREIRDANNHRQRMLVVNENGLDALILGGGLYAAPFFKGYITSVVLPSIRGIKPGCGAGLWPVYCWQRACPACALRCSGGADELSD